MKACQTSCRSGRGGSALLEVQEHANVAEYGATDDRVWWRYGDCHRMQSCTQSAQGSVLELGVGLGDMGMVQRVRESVWGSHRGARVCGEEAEIM
jgi:hypothetical protein